MEIDLIELFSGIGGFALGLEQSGFKIMNHKFSEIDKHAIANYKYNFKNSEYVGPVQDVRGKRTKRPSVVTFGSPCQDFSLAGKQLGMEGQRSVLILEAIRIIRESKPSVFIWENVKGAFSSNDGADFWAILNAFTNIGGYRLEWQLLNTSWVLPQNRERVYLVGYSTKPGRNWRGVFPIGETNKGNAHTSQIKVFDAQNHKWRDDGNTGTLTRMSGDAYRGQFVEAKYTYKKVNETIEQNPNAFKEGEARMMDLHNRKVQDISPCLVEPHHNGAALFNGYGIRRLTPIECERLQGFPDNHTEYGNYDKEVKKMSNTQRYKQCGNAVTVDIVALVAEAVKPLFK